MREKRDIRLFFALWPDDSLREEISRRSGRITPKNGRQVPRYNWHMTLHFIGNTSLDERDCLNRQARKVRAEAFELSVDQTGYFKKPRVLWLGCQHPPDALFTLHQKLGGKISRCEYQPETRAYSPHITIARKVFKEPQLLPVEPIKWIVDKFVLIESVSVAQGVRYDVIESYDLVDPQRSTQ